jgi:hypothetical protein
MTHSIVSVLNTVESPSSSSAHRSSHMALLRLTAPSTMSLTTVRASSRLMLLAVQEIRLAKLRGRVEKMAESVLAAANATRKRTCKNPGCSETLTEDSPVCEHCDVMICGTEGCHTWLSEHHDDKCNMKQVKDTIAELEANLGPSLVAPAVSGLSSSSSSSSSSSNQP